MSGKVVFFLLYVGTFISNTVHLTGQCKTFLVKVGSIIFSDYRLIERFTTECKDDISKFHCGRLGDGEEVCYLTLKEVNKRIISSVILEGAQTGVNYRLPL